MKIMIRNLTLGFASAALGACGGGGGGGASVASIPPAPVAPVPPPTPFIAPFGLATSQQFATFGVSAPSDAGKYSVPTADPNAIKFSWSDSAKAYEVTVPGFAPARLSYSFPGNNPVAFFGSDSSGNRLPLAFSVWRPTDGGLNFTYSSLVFYSTYPETAMNPYLRAQFAYGLPTKTGDMPVVGSAGYDAMVFGNTTSHNGYDIIGDARLNFDFGAGSLTGNMRPRLFSDWDGVNQSLGQYDFTNTTFSRGSTAFSGQFVVPNGQGETSFQGQFTGPNAAELIVGWRAPYLDPFDNQWKSMGGVWLGKKQ